MLKDRRHGDLTLVDSVDEPQLRGVRAQQGQRAVVVRVDGDRKRGDAQLRRDAREDGHGAPPDPASLHRVDDGDREIGLVRVLGRAAESSDGDALVIGEGSQRHLAHAVHVGEHPQHLLGQTRHRIKETQVSGLRRHSRKDLDERLTFAVLQQAKRSRGRDGGGELRSSNHDGPPRLGSPRRLQQRPVLLLPPGFHPACRLSPQAHRAYPALGRVVATGRVAAVEVRHEELRSDRRGPAVQLAEAFRERQMNGVPLAVARHVRLNESVGVRAAGLPDVDAEVTRLPSGHAADLVGDEHRAVGLQPDVGIRLDEGDTDRTIGC